MMILWCDAADVDATAADERRKETLLKTYGAYNEILLLWEIRKWKLFLVSI